MVAQIARILDDGARATTRRVRRDHRNGIDPREETLTQNFISDFVNRVRGSKMRARAREFTKHEEGGRYGADIAIWFVNAAGQFAGVYLQAKVLRQDDTYRGLNHKNRIGTQNKMLIDAGIRDRVLAGYAFYNGLSGHQPASSSCWHGVGAPDINGINIASATLRTPHLGSRVARANIESLCSPLSCLVRHAVGGGSGGGSAGRSTGGSASGSGGGDSPSEKFGADAPAPNLPSATIGLAESWQQREARLINHEDLPTYVKQLSQMLNLSSDQLPDDDDHDYVSNPADWWPDGPRTERVRWSDIKPSFTAVLIGPEES